MKKNIENPEIVNLEEYLPRISLIIPYEPKMNKKQELFRLLTIEADKIEKDLREKYSEERTMLVIKKLRHLIEGVSPGRNGKSIGIFVSPLTEKVYYFTATDPSKTYFPPSLVQH